MAKEALVETKDLGKRFGDFVALHPLDVAVQAGEFFGVFGPNGAGKSTFIKLLTGQLSPSIGYAKYWGQTLPRTRRKSKQMWESSPNLSPPSYLTCAEYLDFVCRIRGVKEIDAKVNIGWSGY